MIAHLEDFKMSDKRGDEWYTPPALVKALGKFDLDPAAPRHKHWTAKKCYTQADNGLTKPWKGRVFMNPPYTKIDPWIYRLAEHGNGIALVFARMGTQWMDQALCWATGICFLDGRLKFVDIDRKEAGAANAPSMLIAYGDNNVEAIASAIVEGKISGRLFREAIPHDFFALSDDGDHSVANPTAEDIELWAKETIAMDDASPFIKWRGKQEAYINSLRD